MLNKPEKLPSEWIEECGWSQGDYGDCDSGFCIVGSIRWAFGMRINRGESTNTYFDLTEKERDIAISNSSTMCTFVNQLFRKKTDASLHTGLALWNDAPETTQDDVLELLREVEEKLWPAAHSEV
jgi:hypothetical protein